MRVNLTSLSPGRESDCARIGASNDAVRYSTGDLEAIIYPISITHIYVAAGHRYFFNGNEKGAGLFPVERRDKVEVVQYSGLRGDRFFKFDPSFYAHVTFFQQEVHDELVETFQLSDLTPGSYRRNIYLSGYNINLLAGKEFTIDGVHFGGTEIIQPCRWMKEAVHPAVQDFLKDRAGLRARALSGGVLHAGPATLEIVTINPSRELAPATFGLR